MLKTSPLMAKPLQPGDRVRWNPPPGKLTGVVQPQLTAEIQVSGQTVAASAADPRDVVNSEKFGKAAHHPDSLEKVDSPYV